jgi:hypothetical protein
LYQVNGFACNSYKGYTTLDDAIRAWEHAVAKQTIGPIEDHGRVPTSSRVQSRPPVVVSPPSPVIVSPAPIIVEPAPSAPSFPRSVIGHHSRVHQAVPLSPRSSISLQRLSTAPVASSSGLLPTTRNPRASSCSGVSATPSTLSVSSLLSSLSSDVESASSLAYINVPMVNDDDFYAVITGVEPGVWKGR